MIWSCRSVLPSQNRDAHLFHVEKNTDFLDFVVFVTVFDEYIYTRDVFGGQFVIQLAHS